MAGYSYAPKKSVPGFEELLENDLKKKVYRPIYILTGDDSLRMEGIVQKIQKDALGAAADFNNHVFDGENVDPGRIFQQAVSLPMLGNFQVIWVKHAEKFLDNASTADHFKRYIEKPVAETILILTMSKSDRRKTWAKLAVKAGYYFEMTNPTGDVLIRWIMKAGKRLNLNLHPDQAALLAELLGQDLQSIKNELDKIALIQEDRGQTLSSEELKELVMDQAELQGYEITEYLMPGSAAKVLTTWYRLADWGRTAYEVSPLLLSRIRRGYLLANARKEHLTDKEIAHLTGQNPWSFKFLNSMITNMGADGLARSQKVALNCDRKLKGSALDPGILFEKAILDITQK